MTSHSTVDNEAAPLAQGRSLGQARPPDGAP